MNDLETKQRIEDALKKFNQGSLLDNGIHLLNTLGYRSERQVTLSPNTFEGLKEIHPPLKNINPQKSLLDDWLSVDILFQLTGEDIHHYSQGRFVFENINRVDNTIMESYLFLAIRLKQDEYSRGKLADLTREINKFFAMPVMVVLQYGSNLTLSIINRRLNKIDEGKDVLEKVTLIKGINLAKPSRGQVEILFDLSIDQLQKKQGFNNFVELHKAWQSTLDISELNKKFYREISAWYFNAVKHVDYPIGNIPDQQERNAVNVIRLITRLIFVWFIKEKGLVPEELFDQRHLKDILNYKDPHNSIYYKAILQNLFFATLNTEMGKDRRFRGRNRSGGQDPHHGISTVYRYEDYFKDSEQALALFAGIPFLNGGLFECLDKREEKILVDGFSDDPRNQPTVPDDLFFGVDRKVDMSDIYGDTRHKNENVRGLIHIFNSYKFTIEENTPLEEEIALDPELLGKVFENLLAAYNPETGTTARKQTGSFYTPREIVNYMVDEALIAYLINSFHADELADDEKFLYESKIRQLLAYHDKSHQFSPSEENQIISAIDKVKVLDPACGSGAFPMGMLHKLVLILNKLDPRNQKWKERQIEKASEIPDATIRDQVLEDIEKSFSDNELDYGRKLFLIENCIYGVDIQPIAVQIAKLRFFISLVVDQKVNQSKPNLGIRPLPNLESKFVAANTLIGIEKPRQMSFHNPQIDEKEKQLAEVRDSLFTARTQTTKHKYRVLDKQLRNEIASLLKKDGWSNSTADQLSDWDPFDQNASAEFFDPEWMFGISNGFDIVIGNPPYVSYGLRGTQSLVEADKSLLRNLYPNSAEYKISLYAVFMDKALQLVKKSGGIQSFIVPDSFLLGRYFSSIRKNILRICHLKEIVLIPFSVFEATIGFSVVYLFIRHQENLDNLVTTSKLAADKNCFTNNNFTFHKYPQSLYSTRPFDRFILFFNGETLDLITKIEENSKDLSKYVTFGSGLISNTGQKKIISDKKVDRDWLPGIISGGEINRYIVKPTGHYLHYKKEVIKSGYGNIKYFTKKLFLRQTGDSLICGLDDRNLLALNNVHVGTMKTTGFPIEVILAIINSKLMNYYYRAISLESGRTMAQTDIETIEKLPIKDIKSTDVIKDIVRNVNLLILAKKTNSDEDLPALECKLDKLIYLVYGINEEEISLIESGNTRQ